MATVSGNEDLSRSEAIRAASDILLSAGLDGSQLLSYLASQNSCILDSYSPTWTPQASPTRHSRAALTDVRLPQTPPSEAVQGYMYKAPQARRFTKAEVASGLNRITRVTRIGALIDHPLNAIVEYPETNSGEEAVAHRFAVDPNNYINPKHNIQYSLGDSHGTVNNATCSLLQTRFGEKTDCKYSMISCKGLKICSSNPQKYNPPSKRTTGELPLPPRSPTSTSVQLVFEKTLTFYCALQEHGCAFDSMEDFDWNLVGTISDIWDDIAFHDDADSISRKRKANRQACSGKLILLSNRYERPLIQCEHRTSENRSHLILRNLDGYHLGYLSALLRDDQTSINHFEEEARSHGYGPRAPCSYSAPPSAQKDLCPNFHRNESGILQRGKLERHSGDCPVTFGFYVPTQLKDCPFVVLISRGIHSHENPFPVKTPPSIVSELKRLLLSLDWRLADATPRKIALDAGFVAGLRHVLGWHHAFEPQISDLHPSLGNADHLRRYIQDMRINLFPHGTGFRGAQLLVEKHLCLPKEERYVRCAESYNLSDGKEFFIIVCMDIEMSTRLLDGCFMTIDTSFKRVKNWQEFEIQSWDEFHMKSVVSARALINSQSAEAHEILFERIFSFAELDTGRSVKFTHIHGEGYRCWVADAHKGQALGLGRFCQKLSSTIHTPCPRDSSRLISELDPYAHLRRFFRLCTVHFKRHIYDLRGAVTPDVLAAMLSIASSDYHPDLSAAFSTISKGGKKAKAWLKDKEDAKFVIPALHQPASLIPLDIWKAAPSDTNGNEQSHRDVNRDGIMLTLIGGIHRGMAYDKRVSAGLNLYATKGIYSRDQQYTSYRRAMKSVTRAGLTQRKVASNNQSSTTISTSAQRSENAHFEDPYLLNHDYQASACAPPVPAHFHDSYIVQSPSTVPHSAPTAADSYFWSQQGLQWPEHHTPMDSRAFPLSSSMSAGIVAPPPIADNFTRTDYPDIYSDFFSQDNHHL